MFEIRKIAITYDGREDRLRLVFTDADASTQTFALTRRLAGQLLRALCQWLEDSVVEGVDRGKLAAVLEARHVESLSAVARRREEAREQQPDTDKSPGSKPEPDEPAGSQAGQDALPRLLTRVGLSRRKAALALQFFVGTEPAEARGIFGPPAVHTIVHRLCRVIANAGWDAGLQVPAWTRVRVEDESQTKIILH